MKQICSTKEMFDADRRAIEAFGMPGIVLMENAGLRAADIIFTEVLKRNSLQKAAILIGPGNNGGDGFVVARHLLQKGIEVRCLILADQTKFKSDTRSNFEIVKKLQIPCVSLEEETEKVFFSSNEVLIDALFGIGLDRDLSGVYEKAIQLVNQSKSHVVSLDIPSGIHGDTGEVLGCAIKAEYTITFGAIKKGLTINEGAKHVGKLYLVDICLPA